MVTEELFLFLLFILGFLIFIFLAAIFTIIRYKEIGWDKRNKYLDHGP
jgi:hypothetical protein